MPAGVFTESVMPDILMQMEDIFAMPTSVQCEFEHPVMSAKLLLERQSVRTIPVLEGTVCKGVKAWFLQAGSTLITHSGTAERTIANCDIAAGTQLQTNSKTYNNNLVIEAVVEVEDAKCDNELTFARESATGLLKAMVDIRKELNARSIALLEANVQPHQFTNTSDFVGGDAAYNANAYKIAPANLTYEALLEMKYYATREQVKDAVVLNVGKNFWLNERVAFYKRLTTTANDQNQIYNDTDIHWDIDNVSQLSTARDTTFVFNPNTIVFWNTLIAQNEIPEQIDSSRNRWAYKIEDPMLMYRKDGELMPVEYDVRYEFTCAGKTTLGEERFLHKYEVTLRGGLDSAPAGFNRAIPSVAELTGVIEFVAEV